MYKKVLNRFIAGASVIGMTLAMVPSPSVQAADKGNEITEVVCDYMDGRENAVATGDVEALGDAAVIGIVNDEITHRQMLVENNIVVSDTSYQILDVDISDTMVTVTLTETMEYVTGGITEDVNVQHSLTIMYDEYGVAKVVSDEYAEEITGFESCSYISEDFQGKGLSVASLDTSDLCSEFVAVAEDEVGYLEKKSNANLDDFTANAGSGNYTKYGEWYGNNGQPWCAMFVSWCANQAEVPTTVIPKYQSCTTGMNTFIDAGRFNYSSTYGGSYTPKVGDIFFTGSSKTSSSHTGIVVAVSGSQITVVDGNWSDQVSRHTYKLTNSSLIGFASPNY